MSNLQLIKDYHELIWGKKDINAMDQYFHQGVLVHSPVRSTEGTNQLKEVISKWHIGFPNLKIHWDDFICSEDKVVAQWRAEGNQDGEFLGVEPTNKLVKYSGVSIYRLSDKKVTAYWAYVDMDHIKKQLTI